MRHDAAGESDAMPVDRGLQHSCGVVDFHPARGGDIRHACVAQPGAPRRETRMVLHRQIVKQCFPDQVVRLLQTPVLAWQSGRTHRVDLVVHQLVRCQTPTD